MPGSQKTKHKGEAMLQQSLVKTLKNMAHIKKKIFKKVLLSAL